MLNIKEKIFERFSERLKNAIANSFILATRFKNREVIALHLLYSLTEEQGSVSSEIIRRIKIKKEKIEEILMQKNSQLSISLPILSEEAKIIIERAMLTAYEREHSYVGTEHLLFSIISLLPEDIESLLKKEKIDISHLTIEVENVLNGANRFSDVENQSPRSPIHQHEEPFADESEDEDVAEEDTQPKNSRKNKKLGKNTRATDVFAVDLIKKAEEGKIDPLIGREAELKRLIHILCRRNKNNPILVGEPGVGKTAIVEGLARLIALKKAPDILRKKKILSIDMALLISGTIYRGEFEARLKQIIDEATKNPDLILFIDEIHNIIGAGGGQGTMDAANILKPALARGELRLIGATTIDEYTKHIAADPALERRFQKIEIYEPSKEEAKKILTGIAPNYGSYHGVKITEGAIEAAVELSDRYIADNHLPDKAIDLIDEAAGRLRAEEPTSKKALEIIAIEDQIEKTRKEKEDAISVENLALALKKKKEEEVLAQKLKKTSEKNSADNTTRILDEESIKETLALRLNVSSKKLFEKEVEGMFEAEQALNKRLIGQSEAITKIISGLGRGLIARGGRHGVKAAILIAGGPGSGKTSLGRALAEELFHSPKNLISFNLGEFTESHSVSKILGSPAGYVGHKERNRFTDELKRRPHCVVMFENLEKAHADVLRLVSDIIKSGEITESGGRTISLKNAVCVLTIGLKNEDFKTGEIGFGMGKNEEKNIDQRLKSKLKDQIGEELFSRLTETVILRPITDKGHEEIIRQQAEKTIKKIEEEFAIKIAIDREVYDYLLEKSARDLPAGELMAKIEKEIIDTFFTSLNDKKSSTSNKRSLKRNNDGLVIK